MQVFLIFTGQIFYGGRNSILKVSTNLKFHTGQYFTIIKVREFIFIGDDF